MGLLRAIGGVFKSIGYVLTGRFDDLAVQWSSNPAAIRATGMAGVEKKQKRLKAIAAALGPQNVQIKQIEGRMAKKKLRLDELPGLIAGAKVKAQESATRKNLTKEQAAVDPEVQRWLTALGNYKKEQDKLNGEMASGKGEIDKINGRRQTLIEQGAKLKAEIEQAGAKIDETVAAVVSAKEEKAANAMMAGLTQGDDGNKELDALDRIREKAEGEASAARDLAGMEVSNVEAELKAAGTSAGNADLLDLLNFKDEVPATPAAPEKLPEH